MTVKHKDITGIYVLLALIMVQVVEPGWARGAWLVAHIFLLCFWVYEIRTDK